MTRFKRISLSILVTVLCVLLGITVYSDIRISTGPVLYAVGEVTDWHFGAKASREFSYKFIVHEKEYRSSIYLKGDLAMQ